MCIRFLSLLENPAVFDDMLNTVLGLPKKGVAALYHTNPLKREKTNPLAPTQVTTNTTTVHESGKRLFESGTYQDPRLIYDVSREGNMFLRFSLSFSFS